MQMLSIDAITLDERCQPRAAMSLELIGDYARAMADGAEFPPLTVFRDGGTYYLADGFHRIAAAQDAGQKHVVCDVRPGTIRDAILHAVGANATHGQRRTNLDKRRAVETLLNDPEWQGWTDNKIATTCSVSNHFVDSLRQSLGKLQVSDVRTFTDRYGNTRTMNTANIGRRVAPAAEPDDDVDDEPEEVPFEIVDTRTGEIIPPMSRNHSMSFMPPFSPMPSRPTTQQEAARIAAELTERHGAGLAIQIADAIYAQCGSKRGAA